VGLLGALSGHTTGSTMVRFEVSTTTPGRNDFEPRAGFADGSGRGLLGHCTFTDLAERKPFVARELADGLMIVNLDLELTDLLLAPTLRIRTMVSQSKSTS
jgi:hypothetical protein